MNLPVPVKTGLYRPFWGKKQRYSNGKSKKTLHNIAHFWAKKGDIGAQNSDVWDQNFENATT
jgi:hypothetical protein